MPEKIRLYYRKKKVSREVSDISEMYDSGYFHGLGYEDYSFEKLKQGFYSKMKLIRKYKDGGRLLDVGCALGFFVKVAEQGGFDAYGVDFSKYAVEQAGKLVGDKVSCVDVEEGLPFENGFFDVVVAWDFLEHLARPELFLRRANRVLRQNGLIFITTLNYKSLLSRIMRENWVFIGSGHLTHTITVNGLRKWLENSGFKGLQIITAMLAVESFADKTSNPTLKRIARLVEKVLTLQATVMLRLLRPLNLGDLLICVAKKQRSV